MKITELSPFEELSRLDRLVHEPARLSILTALSGCRRAEFLILHSLTGLTNGNLSQHLIKLERARLISIEKSFKDKKPLTRVTLTALGRERVNRYWDDLGRLHKAARRWAAARRRSLAGEPPHG